jgi:hypothetical protein
MKNSSNTIGNRTRELRACSAVTQPILTIQNVVKNKIVFFPVSNRTMEIYFTQTDSDIMSDIVVRT